MDCPELHRGCCNKGHCTIPDHQIQISDWEARCAVEGVWRDCPYLPANRR